MSVTDDLGIVGKIWTESGISDNNTTSNEQSLGHDRFEFRAVGSFHAALKNNAASGGKVSLRENGRPWVGISSAWTPPKLPIPLPA